MSKLPLDYIERVLSGVLTTTRSPHEAAWHAVWHERELGALDPVAAAVTGGALADRLSWVFISGYQAAIRQVFPTTPHEGWAAFAATEAKDDPEYPGTRLTIRQNNSGLLLNGYKSWVAQSRKVSHLLVTARPTDPTSNSPTECVYVDAAAEGVGLSSRSSPSFLADMSQGFAEFADVAVSPENLLPANSARSFGRTEARFVMLAGCAHLLAHTRAASSSPETESLITDIVTLATSLAECTRNEGLPALLMGQLDRAFLNGVSRFEQLGLCHHIPSWDTDKRLLYMYSGRIRAREAKSQEALNN